MPEHRIPLEPEKTYHIYNRGINSCVLFKEPTNYEYFLRLYKKHIIPVADTFAYCIMGNHFHLLVRIKSENNLALLPDFEKLTTEQEIINRVNKHFSNLFNAYCKAYNKKYNRTGSLFENRFRRKHINCNQYLKQAILYIHNNPVHHGFCDSPYKYPWSSYQTHISNKPTSMLRNEVIELFNDVGNLKYCQQQKADRSEIDEWVEKENRLN